MSHPALPDRKSNPQEWKNSDCTAPPNLQALSSAVLAPFYPVFGEGISPGCALWTWGRAGAEQGTSRGQAGDELLCPMCHSPDIAAFRHSSTMTLGAALQSGQTDTLGLFANCCCLVMSFCPSVHYWTRL